MSAHPTEDQNLAEAAPELTILMPCLNEAETLEICIRKAQGFLERGGIDGEVVIADNGSTDGSQDIATGLGARVVPVKERGYGAALFEGSRQARGRFIIMGDSDDSYDFSQLDGFVEGLRAGSDMVMGNRFKGGILPGAMPFKNRYLGNPVLSAIGRILFGSDIGDFHCGLRGFTKDAFAKMDLRTTGMEYASEMVIKAKLLGLNVSEVPTKLHPDGRSRPPHLRPWRDGWRHLRFMMLYSPQWIFLYPGLLFLIVGLLLMARLAVGPLYVGAVGFDVHTMLYAAMAVLLGYQGVLFWAFSAIFAHVERLRPNGAVLGALVRTFSVESGLIAGLVLLALGLGGSVWAVVDWGGNQFGGLDPAVTLRIVIPSVLACTIGIETFIGSFFLSMLGLRVRRPERPT